MMIVVWIALYLTIGFGIMWVMLRIFEKSCPEIMEKSNNTVDEQYHAIMEQSSTKRKANIHWFITRRFLPLFVWPGVVLLIVVLSFIAKMRGEM